jgi:hypothetical protein
MYILGAERVVISESVEEKEGVEKNIEVHIYVYIFTFVYLKMCIYIQNW